MTDRLNDDSSLIMLRRQGASGLAHLVNRDRQHLKHIVQQQLGPDMRVRVDASDVIQELFVSASRTLETYLANPRLPPVLWLRGLARRISMEIIRHHLGVAKRTVTSEVRESPTGEDRLLVEELSASMPSPRTQLANDELRERVNHIVHSMAPADRRIIELKHRDNLTLLEASQQLQEPYEAVKKRYTRAIRKLKRMCKSIN